MQRLRQWASTASSDGLSPSRAPAPTVRVRVSQCRLTSGVRTEKQIWA